MFWNVFPVGKGRMMVIGYGGAEYFRKPPVGSNQIGKTAMVDSVKTVLAYDRRSFTRGVVLEVNVLVSKAS